MRRPCDGQAVRFSHNYDVFVRSLLAAVERAPLADPSSLGGSGGGLTCASPDETTLWLEFGVYTGGTLKKIGEFREMQSRIRPAVYGFDSFQGLPEYWRTVWRPSKTGQRPNASSSSLSSTLNHVARSPWLCHSGGCHQPPPSPPPAAERRSSYKFDAGTFRVPRAQPPRLNVSSGLIDFVVGWYRETLPPFLESHRQNVSFVHVDCDLYNSTRTIFDALAPRLHAGTILVFDELFNYERE